MGAALRDQLQASLGDQYVIERELAPGGMSRLFLATEASLERQVVIKLLPPETASEVSAARFHREVLVAARLQHPNILPVLSSGTSGGIFYYIMPYVSGESLRHHLERAGRFPVIDAVRVLREVADALALAHDRGFVHRDIKPANILLLEGHAVLTDFGIARAVEASRLDSTEERLTGTGVGIGTLGYMAPEQLAGEREVDARADVYALAVVAYEMLTGKPPFSKPTAQALVAAHLTEVPPPVMTAAPDVPRTISDAVSKALAKDPRERFATAAQFRDALDVHLTAGFSLAPRRKVSRAAIVGGVAALVVAAAGAAVYARVRAPVLDPNYLVILPFNLRNVDPTMREGMVDALVEGINGQGWVKTVPPSRYVRTWKDNADDATASKLGRQMGAALAAFGSVASLGRDSLSVSAQLLDVATGRKVGTRHERIGPRQNLPRLDDALAKDLLNELNRLRPLGALARPATWLEGTSLPALQAFLVGEQFYRRSAWDSAMAYYQRALDSDSSFALAYRHAGLVLGWVRGTDDSLSRAYLGKAGRFNRGLPRRDSLLVMADSIRSSLTAFETDTSYFATVRRLFRTLRTARDSFPADPEAWYALGDAYFHYGFGPGLSVNEDTIRAAFDRSIKLDSGFTPSYIHAIELALSHDGRGAGLTYADRYLALQPTDEEADGIRVLVAVLKAGGINARTTRTLDTLSMDALQTAWLIARRWTDSTETAVRLLELPMDRRRSEGAFISDPGYHRAFLANELAYRGHLEAAYDTLGTNIGIREIEAFGSLVALGAVPPDTAKAVFARLLHDRSIWPEVALPWWAAAGDTLSLLEALTRADSSLSRASTPVKRRDWRYRTAATRSYLSLARHSTDALARFEALPDTLCLLCYLDRLTKARLLDSIGMHAEAEATLEERPYTLLSPLEITFASARAAVAEKLQQYARAARDYGTVARAWSSGEPVQRQRAAQASTKFGQLGGHSAEVGQPL
ncbi:MAG: protein kinase [Gemmatimonadales bacterium]